MRLNRAGHALGGVDQMVHIDRALVPLPPDITRSGNWSWMTETAHGGPVARGDAWGLFGLDQAGHVVLDRQGGANIFVAGGGTWAAAFPYRDSFGHAQDNALPLAVDNLTGRIALVADYAAGATLLVWDGLTVTTVWPGVLDVLEADFRDGVLLYRAGGRLRAWGAPEPVQVPFSGVRHSGPWILGYRDGVGLTIYDRTTGQGYPLHHPSDDLGHDFNADVADLGDGRVRIASAARAGEYPEDVRIYTVDTRTQSVTFNFSGQPVWSEARSPIDCRNPPGQVLVPPVAPSTTRGVWRGLCDGRTQPGNVVWGGRTTDTRPRLEGVPWAIGVPRLRFLFFSPKETDHTYWPSPEAEAATIVAEVQRRTAAGEHVTVIVYHDGRPWAQMPWLDYFRSHGCSAVPGLNAYPQPRQSAAQTRAAVADDVAMLGGAQVVLFRAVYTQQQTWPTQLVWDVLGETDSLIESTPAIVGDFLFGSGRPGGAYQDWPDIQQWYAARCAALPASGPAIPPKDDSMTPIKEVGLRLAGEYMTAELGGGTHLVDLRHNAIEAWQTWRPYVLEGGTFDVGKRVIFESAEDGQFLGIHRDGTLVQAGPEALVFTVVKGDGAGYGFMVGARPLTCEYGSPGKPFTLRPDGTPVQSWQSFEVVSKADGKVQTAPFK